MKTEERLAALEARVESLERDLAALTWNEEDEADAEAWFDAMLAEEIHTGKEGSPS